MLKTCQFRGICAAIGQTYGPWNTYSGKLFFSPLPIFSFSFLSWKIWAPRDSHIPVSGPGQLGFPTLFFFFFNFFIFSEFCHTLKWNSHGFTCVPHPDPPSHLPLHPLPLGLPSAPGLSACFMHPTWAGDLFPTLFFCNLHLCRACSSCQHRLFCELPSLAQ